MFQPSLRAHQAHRVIAGILAFCALFTVIFSASCSGRSKADKLHTEGVILSKARQYYKAVTKFEDALKLQPNRPDTLVECADIYLKTEKFDLAAKYAEKAIGIAPDNVNAYLISGQAHLALARKPSAELDAAPVIDQAEMARAVETVAKLQKIKPDSIEGILLQGRVDQMNGNLDSARRLFQLVADKSSGKNMTALLGMTEALLASRKFTEAEKVARQAVALENPANSAALNDLALSLALQEKFDAAYELLAPLVSDKNKQPVVTHYLLAGRILLTQVDSLTGATSSTTHTKAPASAEDFKRATERLAKLGGIMKAYFPAMPESFFFRAVSYQLANDIPNAVQQFEQACAKAPEEKRFRLALVLAHMKNKNYSSARQELRTVLRSSPGDRDAQLRMAQCYALEGSFDESIDLLRNLVVDQPTNKSYQEALGKVLVLTSEKEKVKEGMDLLSRISGSSTMAPGNREMMLADATLKEGEKLSAAGKNKEAGDRIIEAERLLLEAARQQPKNSLPELKLSDLAVRRGDLISGLLHARKAAAIDPQFESLEARFFARLGQLDVARAYYVRLLQANEGALGYQLAIADLDIKMGRVDQARKSFEEMIRKHREDPRPYLHLALLIGQPEDVAEAVKFINVSLAGNPESITMRLGLAQVLLKSNKIDEAIKVLAAMAISLQSKVTTLQAQKGLESSAAQATALLAQLDLKLALAELLAGKAAEAARHADEARQKAPKLAVHTNLIKAVARLYDKNIGAAQADTVAPGEKSEGTPASSPLVASLAFVKAGDATKAASAVEGQISIQPGTRVLYARMLQKTPVAKLGEAAGDLALLVTLTQYPEFAANSIALADRLLQALPGEPFVMSIKADTLQALGGIDEALAILEAVHKTAPEYGPVLLAQTDLQMLLAERAQGQGNAGEAGRHQGLAAAACRAYLEISPKDAQACEKMGTILQTAGKIQEADAMYRKAIEIDPGRWSAYNNLAWNLAEANRLDEAAQMGSKALAGAPADGGVQDTVGWIELKRKNADRAVELLTQASLRLPNNPEVRFHLSQAFQLKGNKDRALAELEAIVLATPQYARIQEVRDTIRQLNPHSEVLNNSENGSSPKPKGAGAS